MKFANIAPFFDEVTAINGSGEFKKVYHEI